MASLDTTVRTQADEALRQARATDRVLERFPAGGPYGSRPAEQFAADRRAEGTHATVVMDLATDSFLVKAVTA